MGFEVPISAVGGGPGRGGRLAAAALAAIVAVVVVAVAGAMSPTPREPRTAGASVAPTTTQLTAPVIARAVPAELSCRDVDHATCERMARAAVLVLPADAPEALDATVWRSLLCNDTSDCPPSYLDGAAPLGSVIITFADRSPRAAVNVVEGQSGPIRRAARAWVVRWMPEPG